MGKRFDSEEPLYSMGAAFVEFGQALMDSRTRVAECTLLARRCGLKFCIGLRDAEPETTEDPGRGP